MKRVEYLGPDEFFSFVWGGEMHGFDKGKMYDLDDEVAAQALALNPRGLDVERANDYGAKVFREVSIYDAPKMGGGDQP